MIERRFDIPFISGLALREKQIQQNYRPIIAVHKWFARRPGTLFRGLLLSEFSEKPLREAFFSENHHPGLRIADPFMGGGTPLIEANRIGCDITGFDINPMAWWIVRQEIEHLDLAAYAAEAGRMVARLEAQLGHLYQTRCLICGSESAMGKCFMWVKTIPCRTCAAEIRLFPGYLISRNVRHPRNVFICGACGQLTEVADRACLGNCSHCGKALTETGPARRGKCPCPECGAVNTYPRPDDGPPAHRLMAIEYHCPGCRPDHSGRFFKAPDDADLAKVAAAESAWAASDGAFVPTDAIPTGDETNRLHRWGYRSYHQMFNARQLVGLCWSARYISRVADERMRNALATNFSDLLRYQNMLCRYDTMALKSLDIFSVHGFPVGLIQCESNFPGIRALRSGALVGSGGWANIIEKFKKAKAYCDNPFEVRYQGKKKQIVPIKGEWIGDQKNGFRREVKIECADAARADLPAASLDAVLTDPPYFGNVQYAELMDFCYVWLRLLAGENKPAFSEKTTRRPDELTGNIDMGRGLSHFAEGLSAVFRKMAFALKPGRPLAFTYHHNDISAYYPIAMAILDAGLVCSASLPCPGEMGASIHINGTGSSIIDTIFVCRSTGRIPRQWIAASPEAVADLVKKDLAALISGNVRPTAGDTRCIAYGHLIRLAIWFLREGWNPALNTATRIQAIDEWVRTFGGWPAVERHVNEEKAAEYFGHLFELGEEQDLFMVEDPEFQFESKQAPCT